MTSETHSSRISMKDEESQKLIRARSPVAGHRTVVWTDIKATVPQQIKGEKGSKGGGGRKEVLKEVSGIARPGEILAIMGGSGAGKTTLLNILTHLDVQGVEHTGTVAVNGEVPDATKMRRMSAYVQQIDLFCGTLTVREQLTISAALRMGRHVTKDERQERVENVIREMNLVECQHTLIGIPNRTKGISVGEKKRLAFACEVLTNPSILFCDEPTSGLDSFMAQQVVIALKGLAKHGKTIITVIHQPSTEVFAMFDRVCFMSNGKTAFHGPISELTPFFDSFNIDYLRVPESHNPADHVITQLSIEGETRDADIERVEMIIKRFEESERGQLLHKYAHGELSGSYKQRNNDDLEDQPKYAASFTTQFSTLFNRAFLTTIRDPLLLKVKFVQVLLTAIVIGAINWQTPVTGPTVQNIEGVLYNCARDMNFLFLFPAINVITSELPVFLREHKARIYSVDSYYWAKSFAEMPQYTVLPIIYGIVVYWATGLYAAVGSFLKFLLICIAESYVAISVANTGACLFGDEGRAVTFIPMLALPMLIFGGFYVNFHSIPKYLAPISYLSWFRYGFEGLQINQWTHQGSIQGCSSTTTLSSSPSDFCPAENGLGLLEKRGMHTEDYWFWIDLFILFFMCIVYRILGLFALKLRVRISK